jgi:hypothetical protein
MEIVNKLKDGLHQDNNIYDQPDMTMRDNLNGVITDLEKGNFKWSNLKGNSISFVLGTVDKYFSHCLIKDRLFIITLDVNETIVRLFEITFVGTTGTKTQIWSINNSQLNLSFAFPIRTIFGFYENILIQRIYWSDFNNPPRCINVQNLPTVGKFIDFFPVISKIYGKLTTSTVSSGGSVSAGSVFFVWRFYTNDGYYSDWSYLSNPILVTSDNPGTSFDDYQKMQGKRPDYNTGKKVVIKLENLDSDYDNIQVAAFYSNDYNLALPGTIFFDGKLTSDIMTFTYIGTENIGTVTIDDLTLTSIKIDSFKENIVAKKQNVIACMHEREELDLPAYIEAEVTVATKALPLDHTGYPSMMTSPSSSKALFGMHNVAADQATHTLRRGQYYKAVTQVIWNDGSGNITVAVNNLFYVSTYASTVTWISGEFLAVVLKRKYLLAGGNIGGDLNTNFRFDYELLDNEHYDWKSQKVCKTYKSYPHGETIRLGVLFFDLTGRPFFVRHLRNTNSTYGPGDTNIPKRSDTNPMLGLHDWNAIGSDGYYNDVTAKLQHLIVNDLDITDIKDQISGFMIVRAPIVHQYLGMGILTPTLLSGNNVYSSYGLWPHNNNTDNYFGCYNFYCPEDTFNLKGFVIQPGDEIENLTYLTPYCKDEAYTLGGSGSNAFRGFGRKESNDYDFYQKLFRASDGNTSDSNGVIGATHPVSFVTKYILGDDDLPINPLDGTKLFIDVSSEFPDGNNSHYGLNCNHSILILDIDDEQGNIKGPNQNWSRTDPCALLCAIKRANTDPYGGYTDSSVANTVYVSTGHYQEITPAVLADILTGGRYIFNNIEIFGGDTMVQLFDIKRLTPNFNIGNEHLGHSMIFPVESRINLSMREGEHIAKTRSRDSSNNPDGIQVRTGSTVLEEFSYNDGYSTDDIFDRYLPLPFNFKVLNEYLTRIRYSPEKNYGEKRDSFRVFLANDYIDLDPNKGAITNIRLRNDKLVYWQPDEIGYIPIRERALTQSSAGQSVQLGVGGVFERYDELKNMLGNSHQFGLVESPIGFHWYDSRRKLFLTINEGFQITPDSILKGLDKWFQLNIPDGFEAYDNPISSYGIFGGYDVPSKMVFISFKLSTGVKTIGINASLNKFIGFYNLYPGAYITGKNHLFHVNSTFLDVYTHGIGTYMNFFGTQYHAYVSIVVKEDTNIAKIYDTFEIIASRNFFNKVRYENSEQSKEEVVCDYTTGTCVVTNRDYKYSKKRWFGSFPKVSRERLNDGYLLITFEIENPYLVELYEVKSTVRKNY